MSPRPDVSNERKVQIINAAEGVFTRKGFDQARMDDIAEETGLSKGTLYLYFKSKDELIIAILDKIFQREFQAFKNIDLNSMTATEAFMLFTDTVMKDVKIILRLMPIAHEFLALAFRNKLVQNAFKIYLSHYMDVFIPIIQRGVDTGEFRQLDVQELAIASGAIIEGTLLLWVYDKSLVDPEKHIRSGMKLLLEGAQAHT
jgi:AcrR family transcriptional regulator